MIPYEKIDQNVDIRRFARATSTPFWNANIGVLQEFHMPESIELSIEAIFEAAFADGGFRDESADNLWQVTYPNSGKYAWD